MLNIVLNEYSAAETASITGLKVATQRDWRRRGFLSSTEDGSHARFKLPTLAEIFTMRQMSNQGLWPDIFADVAKLTARGILFHRMKFSDCYEGSKDAIERFCGRRNTPEIKIMRHLGYGEEQPKKYLIAWAQNPLGARSTEFTDNLDAAFNKKTKGKLGIDFLNQEGPVVVFNLEAIAIGLRPPEGKAFVRIEDSQDFPL